MHMFPEIKERRCPHINVAVKAEMGVLQRTKSLSAKEIRKRRGTNHWWSGRLEVLIRRTWDLLIVHIT